MDANIEFELVADAFYRDTHHMRPGKSQPLGCYDSHEDRQAAWDEWSNKNARLIRCFVLAAEYIFYDRTSQEAPAAKECPACDYSIPGAACICPPIHGQAKGER